MDSFFYYCKDNQTEIIQLTLQHLALCGISLSLALILSLFVCLIFVAKKRQVDTLINFLSFLRLIPGIAILVISMPFLGVGILPTIISLTILALPSILVNTYSGIKNIQPSLLESANSLGMTSRQILYRIQLPMALPFIVLGLRTAVVDVVTMAAIASLMGAGGLGRYILTGLLINDFYLIAIGGGIITFMALFSELMLGLLQIKLEKTMLGVIQ